MSSVLQFPVINVPDLKSEGKLHLARVINLKRFQLPFVFIQTVLLSGEHLLKIHDWLPRNNFDRGHKKSYLVIELIEVHVPYSVRLIIWHVEHFIFIVISIVKVLHIQIYFVLGLLPIKHRIKVLLRIIAVRHIRNTSHLRVTAMFAALRRFK